MPCFLQTCAQGVGDTPTHGHAIVDQHSGHRRARSFGAMMLNRATVTAAVSQRGRQHHPWCAAMPAGEARQSADGGGLDAAQPPEHDAQDPFADAGSLAHAHGAAEQAIPAHEVDAAAASAAKQRKLANKLAQKRVRDRQKVCGGAKCGKVNLVT